MEKLYQIGEVMQYSGFSRQAIHNYTMLGLISEVGRTKSGFRLYPESVFERLKKIKRYKRHRTLRQVKEMLDIEDELRDKHE